jgi:hypothetical protein
VPIPRISDGLIADAFTALASHAAGVRRLLDQMTDTQRELVAACCPWPGAGASALLDIDTWGTAVAESLPNEIGMVG